MKHATISEASVFLDYLLSTQQVKDSVKREKTSQNTTDDHRSVIHPEPLS